MDNGSITIIIFALRYAITRQTAALKFVYDHIFYKLGEMTDSQRMRISRELHDILSGNECMDEVAKERVLRLWRHINMVYLRENSTPLWSVASGEE